MKDRIDQIMQSDMSDSDKLESLRELLRRRSGRTTKMLDSAIQLFFTQGSVMIRDHHDGGASRSANTRMVRMFEERLEREHGLACVNYGRHLVDSGAVRFTLGGFEQTRRSRFDIRDAADRLELKIKDDEAARLAQVDPNSLVIMFDDPMYDLLEEVKQAEEEK